MLFVRFLQSGLAGGAAAALALDGAGNWDLTDREILTAAATLFVTATVEPLARGVLERSARAELEFERKVSIALRAALVQIVQQFDLDWQRVGVNAFLVRRQPRRPWRWQLHRVGRERITNTPPPSAITWTRGKGVIGRCWALREDQGFDLAEHFARAQDATRKEWDAYPEEYRLGLSFEEFHRTRQHQAVVATPMLDWDEVIRGVVSVDAPSADFDSLWGIEARGTLQSTAQTIWNLKT